MGASTTTDRAIRLELARPLRVAVAVLPAPNLLTAFDGLRHALRAPTARIPPHCTIAPPAVAEDLSVAIDALFDVSAAVRGPAPTTVGPAATFLPATRTIHLEVDDHDGVLHNLEARFRARAPFDQPRDRPYVPHVTLHPSAPKATDVGAVVAALSGCWSCRFDRVTLLVAVGRGAELRWTPLADRALGPVPVVGRGGIEWSLAESGLPDPVVVDATEEQVSVEIGARPAASGVVITARDGAGERAAVAHGWVVGEVGVLERIDVDDAAERLGVVEHAVAAWDIAARRRGATTLRWDALNP